MSRVAYFQPFSGASGDMALGALVDAGLSLPELESGLAQLRLPGWRLFSRKELRGAFDTTRVHVLLADEEPPPPPPPGESEPRPGSDAADGEAQSHGQHRYSHHHHHRHAQGEHHSHHHIHGQETRSSDEDRQSDRHESRTHATGETHPVTPLIDRRLKDILQLLEASSLPGAVLESSERVFRRLAEAEAAVHGVTVDEVHFHEVGATDSIVDIVGTCLGLHLLDVDAVYSSPVVIGTGFVSGDHGTMPLPAPATSELLKGFPVEHRDSRAELTTPTGAALLTALARDFGTMPPMTITAVGYGAGNDRPGPIPNALRLFLGLVEPQPPAGDRVLVLETLVDDMSPEWLGHLMEKLFEAGALDVTFTPTLMKKARPAQEIKVIVPLDMESKVVATLFREATTFGVRRTETQRLLLERKFETVETPWGPIRVKVGSYGGDIVTASPEFRDLQRAAEKARLPLKEIHQRVLALFDGS